MQNWLDQTFQITANGSSVRTELLAGVTTFLAMAYIIVVNPAILSNAGMDFGAVFVATCLAAALGTAMMGGFANYPIALAPGMGQNAYFTFAVVIGSGHPWQTALGAVFVSGVLFLILSVLPVREWIINAIPRNLKLGIAAGIGVFLAFIGMQNAGIVVDNPATLVGFGELTEFGPVAAFVGFVLIAAMAARGFKAAVVTGILIIAVAGWVFGGAEFSGVVSAPPSMAPVFLQLDIMAALDLALLTVVLSLLLVDLFDTAGTLVGITSNAGMVDENGKLPRLRGALLADSSATLFGSLFGTSSTTSYLESAAGVESGGRTGLTAFVVAGLFLACLLLAPLAQSIPAYASAAALIFVASMMLKGMADVSWEDVSEACPAVITALAIPLSYSIADGIGMGFIAYAGIKLFTGRASECPVAVYTLAAIFLAKFVFF